jgi:DNA-binding NtrC family response regulator
MYASVPKVLLVEGDDRLRGFLSRVLHECGCAVEAVSSYDDGLKRAQVNHFTLCMAGASLPDGSGSDLCRKIQDINTGVPVLICYSRGRIGDLVSQPGTQTSVREGDYVTCQLQQVLNQLVEIGLEAERVGSGFKWIQ